MKILITGRDAGTVRFIAALSETAQAWNWEFAVAAQAPAAQMLKDLDIDCEELPNVTVAGIDDPGLSDLMNMAQDLVLKHSPDLILTTISGPRAGIDEALLRLDTDIARYAYQGYSGNLNLALPSRPEIVFVADEAAVKLTANRLKMSMPAIVPVGSLIAQMLNGRDWAQIRTEARAKISRSQNQPILVFFLQPLEEGSDYRIVVLEWARCASKLGQAILRPHPGHRNSEMVREVDRLGLDILVEPGRLTSVEQIAAADVVTSAYSSANMEAAYINCLLEKPGPVPHYLLPAEIMTSFREATGMDYPPHTRESCAAITVEISHLSNDLEFIIGSRSKFHSAARDTLSVPDDVCANVFTHMREHLEIRKNARSESR